MPEWALLLAAFLAGLVIARLTLWCDARLRHRFDEDWKPFGPPPNVTPQGRIRH